MSDTFYSDLCKEEQKLIQMLEAVRKLKRNYELHADSGVELGDAPEFDSYEEVYDRIILLNKSIYHRLNTLQESLGCSEGTLKKAVEMLIEHGIVRQDGENIVFISDPLKHSEKDSSGDSPKKEVKQIVYDYILSLDTSFQHKKTDISKALNCSMTYTHAAVALLKQEEIIEDGTSNRFIKFTTQKVPVNIDSDSEDDYFGIDPAKELEYKNKIKPYVRRDSRPLSEYLKP